MNHQLTSLSEHNTPEETTFIEVGTNKIPVRFKKGSDKSKALIVTFHGAIDRTTRQVPAFVPWFPDLDTYAHQLSVSDPSLLDHEDITLAWYSGSESFSLQSSLSRFLDDFADTLGVSKLIFFGTSGGGFAALYNNWHSRHDFSIAIAGNPQTNILRYYNRHIDNYFKACWSSVSDRDKASENITSDITSLYKEKFEKTVIYIQSCADEFHITNHATPFLQAIAPHKAKNLILDFGFWGRFGHSPSFEAYLPWIRSALLAATSNKNDILVAKSALSASATKGEELATSKRIDKHGFKRGDMNIADTIKNWILSQ